LLVDGILPNLNGLDPRLPPLARLAQAVESNIRCTVRAILESPEGRARLAEGWMKLIGAIYELETGRVRFLR
jgi:carbonic anhydrase